MPYLIALGHDQALEDLNALIPQPATVGYQYGRRSYAASGAVIDELPHVEFEYSAVIGDSTADYATQYQALLAQCGLTTAKTALVTVYIQDENYDWVLKNGTIVKPQIGVDGQRDFVFLRNFTILVHSLRAVA